MVPQLIRRERLSRPRWPRVAYALVTCAAVGSTLAWAAVHIRLESSVPEAGAVLSAPPERFELRFSGPVNEALSSLVLITPAGDSAPVAVASPDGDDRMLAGDAPGLAGGEYLVSWKTVSGDGHPVSGEFGFTYADTEGTEPPQALPPGADDADIQPSLEAETGDGGAAPVEPGPAAAVVLLAGLGIACLLGFAGLLWFCGSLALMREPAIRRTIAVLGWGALLILGAQHVAWVRSVLPPGAGVAGVSAALGSSTGAAGLARLAFIVIALAAMRRHGRAAAVLALIAVILGAILGHAATISPWTTIPAKMIHLGSASVWFGGLLLLLLAPDGPTDGSDTWRFGALVHAVSGAALLSVLLVAASGMVQSVGFVGEFSSYTGTPYGRGVLVKWAGFLALAGFGAVHRFRTIPELERSGGARGLRRTVRLETIVMLAVVTVAAWLARVSPPAGH